jgi:hypothetical protein
VNPENPATYEVFSELQLLVLISRRKSLAFSSSGVGADAVVEHCLRQHPASVYAGLNKNN